MTAVDHIVYGARASGRTSKLVREVDDSISTGKRPLVVVANNARADNFWAEYSRGSKVFAGVIQLPLRRTDIVPVDGLQKARLRGSQYDCLVVDDAQDVLLQLINSFNPNLPTLQLILSFEASDTTTVTDLGTPSSVVKDPQKGLEDPTPTVIWWTGDLSSYAVVVAVLQDQPESRQLQWLKGKHDALIIMPADKSVEDCLEDGDFTRVPVEHGFSISEDGITVHPPKTSAARRAMPKSQEDEHKTFINRALDAATDPSNYSGDMAKLAQLMRSRQKWT